MVTPKSDSLAYSRRRARQLISTDTTIEKLPDCDDREPPSASELRLRSVENNLNLLRARGLAHLTAEDHRMDGRILTLGSSRLVNFGSCSYLGLEVHPLMKAAAHDALDRYGTQFSSSRAYVSTPLYAELEKSLLEIFDAPSLVIAPTTTLGHSATLPVLVEERDAVLFDLYVHNSVQSVLPSLKQRGIHCEAVPHARLERVAARAQKLSQKYRRVFYLCDGVYSMHGNVLDVDGLYAALERVPSLFAYVDDAHGLGWAGKRGAGVVLGARPIHERMVVAFGMSKGMAAAGGVFVFADPLLARRVFTCGSSMIFSGPIQPPLLGAALASAAILLSPELETLQARLRARIDLFDTLATEYGLLPERPAPTPIRFIEIGDEGQLMDVACELKRAGYFVNAATFPAVARGRAGLRIMLNANQTLEDVKGLVQEIARLVCDRGVRHDTIPALPTPESLVALESIRFEHR
jgi:7-keto-8-aminopelargonate synthetase-like enzyme